MTPYLAIELERSGQPPNLLAGVGSAVLFDDQGQPAAGPTSLVPTFLAARYSRDALGLVLPLAASHRYTVESAAVSLVGATGTWDAGNHWTVALSSRSASLGVDTVLATGTFTPATSSGAGTVNLSPAAAVDGDLTPALAVSFAKVGSPGMLLGAAATVSLDSVKLGQPTSTSYDGNGNTVAEVGPSGAVTYSWNGENRLRAVNENGALTTHTYAATGLRRTKTTPSGTTHYLWDGQNLLAELDEALAAVAQYTDWPGQWGGLSSRRADGESGFYGFDLSANTRQWLSTVVEQAYAYRAFGPELTGGGDNPYRFGGQVGYYRDAADRLYVRARYLEAELARWLSPDPLPVSGQQLYGYAANLPLMLVDPSGRQPFSGMIDPPAMVRPVPPSTGPPQLVRPPAPIDPSLPIGVLGSGVGALAYRIKDLLLALEKNPRGVAKLLEKELSLLGQALGWASALLSIPSIIQCFTRASTNCNTFCCSRWQCLEPCALAVGALVSGVLSLLSVNPIVGVIGAVISIGLSVAGMLRAQSLEHCFN